MKEQVYNAYLIIALNFLRGTAADIASALRNPHSETRSRRLEGTIQTYVNRTKEIGKLAMAALDAVPQDIRLTDPSPHDQSGEKIKLSCE